jgi:hypothetical protein
VTLAGRRAAAWLLPWWCALGPVPALAQDLPAAVFDQRLQPPFSSPEACLDFARGDGAQSQAQPAVALICNQLDRVWQDPTSAKAAADNPLRIDLGAPRFGVVRASTPGTIDGAVLARILTVPQLLPPRLGAGLVLEGLIVTSTLDLTDAAIDMPVVLRRARFHPAEPIPLEDHFAAVAIRLDRVHFVDSFEIRESDLGGHLLIDDSTFAGGLALADVVISSRGSPGAAFARHAGTMPALRMRHARFHSDLLLDHVVLFNPPTGEWTGHSAMFNEITVDPRFELRAIYAEAGFQIEDSELGTIEMSDFRFPGNFILERNSITRMEITAGRFYDTPYINHNRVGQSVTIRDIGVHLQSDDYDPELAVNQIGGSFTLAPAALNGNVKRLDLTYNRIEGLASIFPPDQSTAEIDLSNVQIPTRLEVGSSYSAGAAEPRLLFRANQDLEKLCEEPGAEDPIRLINLTNAAIEILAWNYPIACNVRWDGTGLSYAYWGDPDLKSDMTLRRSDDDFIEALKSWRYTMRERNSEALDYMATYLHSRGRFSDSRDLRQEAKEVNYHPGSLVDPGGWTLVRWRVPAAFGVASGLTPVWLLVGPETWTGLGGWVVYLLLLPTGFGVKPELALLWLFVGWLVGGAVYQVYRRRSQALGWAPAAGPQPAATWALRDPPAGSPEAAGAEQSWGEPEEQPSLVPGFMQYQRDRRPADFSTWAFSADAVLPVINLHAYTEYYPRSRAVRAFSFVQHIIGWWMLSVFLASAAIL